MINVTVLPKEVLVVNPFSFLLRLFPSFSNILHATKEYVAPGSINAYTDKEFNYSIHATTSRVALKSSCVK
jgi:hypothetical protein